MSRELWDRFLTKVSPEPNTGCWLWALSCVPDGYGQAQVGGRKVSAHRFAWTLARGAIPPGLQVLHRCDCPSCVNPDHLFLGTRFDNMRDMAAKGRGRNGGAKLTEAAARAILALRAAGCLFREIAAKFSISRVQAQRIARGRRSGHAVLAAYDAAVSGARSSLARGSGK